MMALRFSTWELPNFLILNFQEAGATNRAFPRDGETRAFGGMGDCVLSAFYAIRSACVQQKMP
jgi:hypothetical protein